MPAGATRRFRILIADHESAVLEGYAEILSPDGDLENGTGSPSSLDEALFGTGGTKVAAKDALPQDAAFELTLCRQGVEAVEAVRCAQQAEDPISLAVLDMNMPPGIGGLQTAERIREIDPDINLVFVTGRSDAEPRKIAERVAPADKQLFYQKPLRPMELKQLAHAITAKWAAEKELASAKEAFERASRAKSEFLANVGHELRTPLNAILGFSELFEVQLQGPLSHERYLDYGASIHSSGQALLEKINDLLEFATIEAGEVTLEESDVDLGETIARTVEHFEEEAHVLDLRVKVEPPDNLPLLRADERLLRKLLEHLLSNAIKFSPKGGDIVVAPHQEKDGRLRLSIRDPGVGMAVEQIEVTFSPFGQVDGGLNPRYAGLGIGLNLSVAIAHLHGADLQIESEPGGGTSVTVTFPAKRVQRLSSSNSLAGRVTSSTCAAGSAVALHRRPGRRLPLTNSKVIAWTN